MDLTSLAMFLAVIASAVGMDTVLHPTSVVLEATVAGPELKRAPPHFLRAVVQHSG